MRGGCRRRGRGRGRGRKCSKAYNGRAAAGETKGRPSQWLRSLLGMKTKWKIGLGVVVVLQAILKVEEGTAQK